MEVKWERLKNGEFCGVCGLVFVVVETEPEEGKKSDGIKRVGNLRTEGKTRICLFFKMTSECLFQWSLVAISWLMYYVLTVFHCYLIIWVYLWSASHPRCICYCHPLCKRLAYCSVMILDLSLSDSPLTFSVQVSHLLSIIPSFFELLLDFYLKAWTILWKLSWMSSRVWLRGSVRSWSVVVGGASAMTAVK